MGWSATTRLPRDHYVRLASNDYSVHPSAAGRIVHVTTGLDTVRVNRGGELVAGHARYWARHQTLTGAGHRAAAARMRGAYRAQHATGPRTPAAGPAHVVTRSLAGYDVLFPAMAASSNRAGTSGTATDAAAQEQVV